ncbi:MAG: hypothetical protein ACREP3_03335, partial [Candidatus Binatia bacterium]
MGHRFEEIEAELEALSELRTSPPIAYLHMTMLFRPPWYFFIALVSITFIGPLSIHLFIPAMPAVKEDFGVSTGMAQLTLSLGMLSMAFFTIA